MKKHYISTKSVLVAVFLAVVTGLVTSPSAGSAVAVTTDAIYRSQMPAVFLPGAGGVATNIISTTVPAGNWVIQFKAQAVSNGSPPDYTRCVVHANGLPRASGTVYWPGTLS